LSDTALGDVVADGSGFTVYLFLPDDGGDSTCYGECESNWPFVAEVTGVGEGLDASLLGTTERTTGERQATYGGWPLYGYAGDVAPGDTTGQGVGGVWFAIDATGAAIAT
jgi:predicted lipoprotein with Yx(FWY)xxD motif